MKKLGIKGHKTRGEEIIKILKTLTNGRNEKGFFACDPNELYVVNGDGIIEQAYDWNFTEILTLEEFLNKYPYKIGDKVRIPEYESEVRISDMKWDGYNVQYEVITDETEWYTAEELNQFNNGVNMKKDPIFKIGDKAIYDGDVVEIVKSHWHVDQYIYYFYHNGVLRSSSCLGLKSCKQVDPEKINQYPLLQQLKKYFEETPRDVIEKEWNELSYLNEIGPTVEEYLESVKKYRQTQYPKTVTECYNRLEDDELVNVKTIELFRELINARNTYWKIAGDWKPDWKGDSWRQLKYCITVNGDGELERRTTQFDRRIFAFPTEEMMNAFYENFKDKLEICKEFI